ncbi:MAG: site-specific DNA-methyltransferase, partial [Oscillospiraceae bacterium]
LDKLQDFEPASMFSDKTIYDTFGANTILTTWLVHDGYGFNHNAKSINLNGYTAYWCDKHLYLIEPDFGEETIRALVEKYNSEGEFNPQNVVVFGYSFNFTNMESLKTNLKILKDSEKNLKINIDIRY